MNDPLELAGRVLTFIGDPLELVATVLTLACVVLGVKRSLWQFPVGLAGTAVFFIVTWKSEIYANAALQVFFVCVQIYGWWYWVGGAGGMAGGRRPPIRTTPLPWLAGITAAVLAFAGLVLAPLLGAYAKSTAPLIDATVFALSVEAQFFLDRKRIETWWLWTPVNLLSVILYAQAHRWLFAALYVFFFFNAFWGWLEWRKHLGKTEEPQPGTSHA